MKIILLMHANNVKKAIKNVSRWIILIVYLLSSVMLQIVLNVMKIIQLIARGVKQTFRILKDSANVYQVFIFKWIQKQIKLNVKYVNLIVKNAKMGIVVTNALQHTIMIKINV